MEIEELPEPLTSKAKEIERDANLYQEMLEDRFYEFERIPDDVENRLKDRDWYDEDISSDLAFRHLATETAIEARRFSEMKIQALAKKEKLSNREQRRLVRFLDDVSRSIICDKVANTAVAEDSEIVDPDPIGFLPSEEYSLGVLYYKMNNIDYEKLDDQIDNFNGF